MSILLSITHLVLVCFQHGDCMRVVYRMRGLLGDATEDMVEKLDDGKDKNVDEEQEFRMAAVLSRCEGLDAVMCRLACVRDFVRGHQLISAALRLLVHCTKLKVGGLSHTAGRVSFVCWLVCLFVCLFAGEQTVSTSTTPQRCQHSPCCLQLGKNTKQYVHLIENVLDGLGATAAI